METLTRTDLMTASPNEFLKNCCVQELVPLEFNLSDYRFFLVGLRCQVLKLHFTELMDVESDIDNLPSILPAGTDAFVVRSWPLGKRPQRIVLLQRYIRYAPAYYKRYYIGLRGSFEEYLGKFSAKSRSTLLRKVHKFEHPSSGSICFKQFRTPEEMAAFHVLARLISTKTYQERLLHLGLPADDEFLQTMANLAVRDSVRGYMLFQYNTPVAYLYCPIRDNILLHQYQGYDPDFRKLSPGTVLQYLTLESVFAEGKYRMFDFNAGEGQYKEFFSTDYTVCAEIYYMRRSCRNFVLLLLHSSFKYLSPIAGRVLDSLGLKARVKRFLRFGS